MSVGSNNFLSIPTPCAKAAASGEHGERREVVWICPGLHSLECISSGPGIGARGQCPALFIPFPGPRWCVPSSLGGTLLSLCPPAAGASSRLHHLFYPLCTEKNRNALFEGHGCLGFTPLISLSFSEQHVLASEFEEGKQPRRGFSSQEMIFFSTLLFFTLGDWELGISLYSEKIRKRLCFPPGSDQV